MLTIGVYKRKMFNVWLKHEYNALHLAVNLFICIVAGHVARSRTAQEHMYTRRLVSWFAHVQHVSNLETTCARSCSQAVLPLGDRSASARRSNRQPSQARQRGMHSVSGSRTRAAMHEVGN